jgi:hypothetical protein
MVEKQASSEIAQSRARFEKWAKKKWKLADDSWQLELTLDLGYYSEAVNYAWISWQAAERDTRERCAKLSRSLLDLILDVTLNDLSQKNGILDTFEQRIRGKE